MRNFGDAVEIEHAEIVTVEGVDVPSAVKGPVVRAGLSAAQ